MNKRYILISMIPLSMACNNHGSPAAKDVRVKDSAIKADTLIKSEKGIAKSKAKKFKDTFQFIGTGENEDNFYLVFLDKKLDTTNIVFLDDIDIETFQNQMVEIDGYWKNMVSGGDAEVRYDQAFASQYKFVSVKHYR